MNQATENTVCHLPVRPVSSPSPCPPSHHHRGTHLIMCRRNYWFCSLRHLDFQLRSVVVTGECVKCRSNRYRKEKIGGFERAISQIPVIARVLQNHYLESGQKKRPEA